MEFSPRAQEILKMLDNNTADVERIIVRAEQLSASIWYVQAHDVLAAIHEECERVPDTPTIAERAKNTARLEAEARRADDDDQRPQRQPRDL